MPLSPDQQAALRSKFRERIVLIADDEPDVLELISDALEDVPVRLVTAATAEAAIDAVRNYVIDMAIVDIFMPGKGGLWLIDESQRENPEAVIAIMSGGWTGMEAEKAVRAAEKLGVSHTFMKPFDIDALVNLVNEVITAD